MVQIPARLKPAFLKPDNVVNDDLASIVDSPYIQDAEKSRFGKERTVLTIQLKRTEQVFRWGINSISNDRLREKFGSDGEHWIGKQIKIHKRKETVAGQERDVLYALPVVAPTEKL